MYPYITIPFFLSIFVVGTQYLVYFHTAYILYSLLNVPVRYLSQLLDIRAKKSKSHRGSLRTSPPISSSTCKLWYCLWLCRLRSAPPHHLFYPNHCVTHLLMSNTLIWIWIEFEMMMPTVPTPASKGMVFEKNDIRLASRQIWRKLVNKHILSTKGYPFIRHTIPAPAVWTCRKLRYVN